MLLCRVKRWFAEERDEDPVEVSRDVALETSHDLALGLAVVGAFRDVLLGVFVVGTDITPEQNDLTAEDVWLLSWQTRAAAWVLEHRALLEDAIGAR